MRTIRLFRGRKLKATFTVEEVPDTGGGEYIATYWNPEHCLEVDRDVVEFETYGAALACMYELALDYTFTHTDLKLQEVENIL